MLLGTLLLSTALAASGNTTPATTAPDTTAAATTAPAPIDCPIGDAKAFEAMMDRTIGGADEARVERAGEAHEHRAHDEGREPEAHDVLAQRGAGHFIVADRALHPAPGRLQERLQSRVDHDQQAQHHGEIGPGEALRAERFEGPRDADQPARAARDERDFSLLSAQ